MNANSTSEETLALMAIMALGRKEVEDGEHELAEDFFARMRNERSKT